MTVPIVRRLLGGLAGQAFARVVALAGAVLLVPLYIHTWGLSKYGGWLTLSAIMTFLSYSNFGLVTIAGNQIVMLVGSGKFGLARRTLEYALGAITFLVTPIIISLASIIACAYLFFQWDLQAGESAVFIVPILALNVLATTYRGLASATLYSAGRYGLVYGIAGVCRLIEFGLIALSLAAFGAEPVQVAAAISGIALLECLVLVLVGSASQTHLVLRLRMPSKQWLVSQIRPTIGFLSSNLTTQGVMVQMPRLLIAATLGTSAVAIFSVYVTAVRFVDQALMLLIMPIEVEIARSYMTEHVGQGLRLIVHGTQAAIFISLAYAVGLLLFGPILFDIWTNGEVEFNYGLMAALLGASIIGSFGRVSQHSLIATNKLFGPSFLMLFIASMAVIFPVLVFRAEGLSALIVGLVAGELAISTICVLAATRVFHGSAREFLIEVADVRGAWQKLVGRRGFGQTP